MIFAELKLRLSSFRSVWLKFKVFFELRPAEHEIPLTYFDIEDKFSEKERISSQP